MRENEPRPLGPIGDPPAEFLVEVSPTAQRHLRIWRELVARAPEGVLTRCDRAFLETACRVQALIEQGDRSPGMLSVFQSYLDDMFIPRAEQMLVLDRLC